MTTKKILEETWENGNILHLDHGSSYPTAYKEIHLNVYFKRVNFSVYKLQLEKSDLYKTSVLKNAFILSTFIKNSKEIVPTEARIKGT